MLIKNKRLLIGFIVSLISLAFCFSDKAIALENADISSVFNIAYHVDPQNKSQVELSVEFKNVDDDLAVLSSYDLKIGTIQPDNISVTHEGTDLDFSLVENSGLSVRVNLGETKLSPGETYSFTVSGEIADFLNLNGGCYEKMLSTLVLAPDLHFNYIKISYPKIFGDINVTNLEPEAREENGYIELTYSNLSDSELIFLSLGNSKKFSFNIERELENPTETYLNYQLVLPPDTEAQSLVINSIIPYPDSAFLTDEGNYQLNYQVPPESDVWVRIGGFIKLESDSDSIFPLSRNQQLVLLNIDSDLLKITDSDLLSEISALDGDISINSKIDNIYNYVKDSLYLSENFRSLHEFEYRKGANTALSTYKNASAEDFADTFVAISRFLRIPSRVVYGYVFPYSSSGGELGMFHVWPQYWEESSGWVSVDPSYDEYSGYNQRAGFGFNHVILGVDSNDLDQSNWAETSGEILVTQQDFDINSQLSVRVDFPEKIESGTYYAGNVTLENRGDTILSNINISENNTGFEFTIDERTLKSMILPGESIIVGFDTKFDKWYETGEKQLNILVTAESPNGSIRIDKKAIVELETVWWGEPLTWFLTILLFLISSIMIYFLGRLVIRFGKYILRLISRKRSKNLSDNKVMDSE